MIAQQPAFDRSHAPFIARRRVHRFPAIVSGVLLVALVMVAALIRFAGAEGHQTPPPHAVQGFEISILSSSPDMVTGGDALVRVSVPPPLLDRVRVELNGNDITSAFAPAEGHPLLAFAPGLQHHARLGLVQGFVLGENTLTVRPTGHGLGQPAPARLTVMNHPITGPIFSGPQQYPFVCKTEGPANSLGQPLIDNQDGTGFPVFKVVGGVKTGEVIGWSKDCSATTRVEYWYRTTFGALQPLPADGSRPGNLAQTTLLDGRAVDYVVRWERGTINRFIYSIAMLAPFGEDPAQPDRSRWNGRLIYSFQGGVGIGHQQGEIGQSTALYHNGVGLGYAVVYSTGNRTSVHYNLQVGGETALMVKERFIERHGVPLYTVGVGGSGGAIQQYVYAQNHPELLDAAIPQYSYPDMVTQTIHVGDCELLEYYMDVTDGANSKWQNWENRTWLIGLNASNTIFNPYTRRLGSSECVRGWRGLSPLAMNPHYGTAGAGQELMSPPGVMNTVRWTHWDDLRNIYGLDEDGYARSPGDNVGVQYGLQALRDGNITPAEFLHLNANIGGWKKAKEMVQEGAPFLPGSWDPWSSRNQNLSPDRGITPALRTEGTIEAMNAAYTSGMVFDGWIDIPVIDWRHYLEEALDMHNSHQSFAARRRIIERMSNADNQVIWFTDARPSPVFDQTPEALQVIEQWVQNIKANPRKSVAENKPPLAVDRCFTTTGAPVASGDQVWDGILNDKPAGPCTALFPIYSTSRIVAGGPLKGGIFKCRLKSVDAAIADWTYGWWVPDFVERLLLEATFPTGVCDYSLPDAGRPGG